MSDQNEGDLKPDSSSSKRSLKTATSQLKAEALRRLQLADAEYDNDEKSEEGDLKESNRDSSNVLAGSANGNEGDSGEKRASPAADREEISGNGKGDGSSVPDNAKAKVSRQSDQARAGNNNVNFADENGISEGSEVRDQNNAAKTERSNAGKDDSARISASNAAVDSNQTESRVSLGNKGQNTGGSKSFDEPQSSDQRPGSAGHEGSGKITDKSSIDQEIKPGSDNGKEYSQKDETSIAKGSRDGGKPGAETGISKSIGDNKSSRDGPQSSDQTSGSGSQSTGQITDEPPVVQGTKLDTQGDKESSKTDANVVSGGSHDGRKPGAESGVPDQMPVSGSQGTGQINKSSLDQETKPATGGGKDSSQNGIVKGSHDGAETKSSDKRPGSGSHGSEMIVDKSSVDQEIKPGADGDKESSQKDANIIAEGSHDDGKSGAENGVSKSIGGSESSHDGLQSSDKMPGSDIQGTGQIADKSSIDQANVPGTGITKESSQKDAKYITKGSHDGGKLDAETGDEKNIVGSKSSHDQSSGSGSQGNGQITDKSPVIRETKQDTKTDGAVWKEGTENVADSNAVGSAVDHSSKGGSDAVPVLKSASSETDPAANASDANAATTKSEGADGQPDRKTTTSSETSTKINAGKDGSNGDNKDEIPGQQTQHKDEDVSPPLSEAEAKANASKGVATKGDTVGVTNNVTNSDGIVTDNKSFPKQESSAGTENKEAVVEKSDSKDGEQDKTKGTSGEKEGKGKPSGGGGGVKGDNKEEPELKKGKSEVKKSKGDGETNEDSTGSKENLGKQESKKEPNKKKSEPGRTSSQEGISKETTKEDLKEDEGGKKKNSKTDKKEEMGESIESSADGGEAAQVVDGQEGEQGEEQEDTEAGGEVPKEEEERLLPDDFYYDYDDLASKPYSTEGIPNQLISFHHSFGYECTKRSNLHVIDEDIALFAAGNMVELLNLKTREQRYLRTTGGGGIGAIAVHPSRKYFAVAEKGTKPDINIFEYPSLKLYRVLREGTEEAYAHLDFSPDGTMLASVGSTPDFMLTVWDWKNEKVLLRSKAFSQDVYKVAFSPENEGHLATSGSGHIRFWEMADTFTGLKLQGLIGKFGAKEISDIEGFVELPDGKVLSGSEWGNMLLWDGGLIKVEISKKGRKTCHNGMIEQFFMDEGELMTIGMDGHVKVWDFESIDNADTTEEGQLFEMDPMYELKVGADVKLMSMQKAVNSEAPIWYAQDAAGGIWKLDLSFTHTSHAPERMFSFHAGLITGLDTSPVAHYVATTGLDYTVRVYDYVSKTQMCHSKYNTGGTSLLWVPKIVDSKGSKILAGFADGVVRLLTLNKADPAQVRSKKTKSNFELNLVQVFKPHTKPITIMTIDKEGELLATGSEDCTVFFFSIGEKYKPIGFVETASPVMCIEWSNKGKKGKSLLVSCKDGTVLEVEAPDPDEHDTSKTFHLPLTDLKITEYQFKSVKNKLRAAEEAAKKAKEEEEKRKKKEAERARRRARGLEEEEEEEEEEEAKEEEVEEQVPEEHGPSHVIKGFYHGNNPNRFWLSMDGWDAGYLYECDFDEDKKPPPGSGEEDKRGEPVCSIPVDNSNDVPIRSVYFTHSGRFLMFGMDDGRVRIHPVEYGAEIDTLSNYWSFSIHDNHHGAISQIRTSFDDKYVFTVGAEGNFFVHQFMDKAVKGLKLPHKISIPSPKRLIGEDGQEIKEKVDDIDDPNFYSIELEKQKAEHDRMMKLAEEKKQKVRRKITDLRRAFKQLMTRNQGLPEHVQLRIDEFVIDPEIRKELESKTQEKIDLVHKEMAWESEKHAIGLRKLQKRFKDEIECERIVLRAFLTPHEVSSFRAGKPDHLQQLLQEAEGPAKGGEGAEGGQKKSTAAFRAAQLRRQSTADKMMAQQQQMQQPGGGQSQLGGKVAKALEKAEARRQKRLARQAQWNDLNRNKPDENYEDPKDKAAIKEARENMGDYKLKTAKDYVVPESQRVNADKKRVQLLRLLDQIHQYKFDFNQRFLALRDKKVAIIKEAKESIEKLEKLQKKMEFHSRRPIPKVPEMKPDECPEKRLEYTRERLLQFKKELEEKSKLGGGHDDGGGGGFGGFGGFGGGGEPSKHGPGKAGVQPRDRSISSVSVHSTGRPRSSLSGVTEKGTPEPVLEDVPEEPTPLEQELQYEERIRLSYEQDVLVDNINQMLRKFDADLRTLRHDKMITEVAIKCGDLRQVTLFEEYVLLKDFEKRENVYANKVNTKLNEKEEMQDKVEDCQMKLDAKKQDIEKLQDQEKALYASFATALGENNKFENFLTKVFKKKIKRAKKKAQTEEGSDDESDDEDSDDDFSSSDEEDSDAEELDDSVCPPGCDQALFDQACQLRERRLDLEELLAEEKKTSETLKKEMDALIKKAKVIDGALKTAEGDLEAFQREKQQKLNELDVVVVLRLHQIQHMINNVIPQDLSNCLVFCGSGLVHLQTRIKGLEKEKHEQKRLYREHRQTHVQLIRDKKVMETRIGELEEKVRNMMMLKFGRLVDLEKLETVTVNRTVEELKEKLRQAESLSATEIAKWDAKIDSYKQKTTQLTRENTQRLDTFTVLLQEKKELEQMLDSRQKSLGTEFTGARKADLRERQRLVQLVQLQAQEIDALKDEITLLSRKGGHILPPAQPPLPPGQTPIPNQ